MKERSAGAPLKSSRTASIAARTHAGGSPSLASGKRLTSRWRVSASEPSGSAAPTTNEPRQTRAQRPIGVSNSVKTDRSTGRASAGLLVVAGEVGVARRGGGGEAQRLGRLTQRADLVRSVLIVDLNALKIRHQGFFEVLRLHRLLRDLAQRSEEHTSELQSLMRISYAVFCLKK